MSELRPPVVAVVVNWNTSALLDDCMRNLHEHLASQDRVIVVDNGSTDGSCEMLRRDWPHVELIANPDNRGFCRASNQGIRASTEELVLLINTDGRLTPGCLEAMGGCLASDPQAGIVGPRLEYGDGSFQRWTGGRPLTVRSCASFFLHVDRLANRWPALGGMYLSHDERVARRVGWVSSAVMLVRRACFDDVGLLDEDIFVYMDDVDLCDRARSGGWHVWYDGTTTATHFMGASSARPLDGRASPAAIASLNRWFARRRGRGPAAALRAVEVAGFASRAAAYGLRSMRPGAGEDRAERQATDRRRARAHLQNIRPCLGAVRPSPAPTPSGGRP